MLVLWLYSSLIRESCNTILVPRPAKSGNYQAEPIMATAVLGTRSMSLSNVGKSFRRCPPDPE